jgi:hypothetical protein
LINVRVFGNPDPILHKIPGWPDRAGTGKPIARQISAFAGGLKAFRVSVEMVVRPILSGAIQNWPDAIRECTPVKEANPERALIILCIREVMSLFAMKAKQIREIHFSVRLQFD